MGSIRPDDFHDYACAKCYDILSKGRYKKFLAQSRSAGEEWAHKTIQSVQVVQCSVDAIQKLLDDLPSWDTPGVDCTSLAQACVHVLDMPLPPKKRRHLSSKCCITGMLLKVVCTYHAPCLHNSLAWSFAHTSTHNAPCLHNSLTLSFACAAVQGEEGIEVMRLKSANDTALSDRKRKKNEQQSHQQQLQVDVVVHPRNMHFLHMVWFIGRIDHVLRSIVRCWQFKSGSSSMSCSVDSCHKFLEENSGQITSLGIMFTHAVMHTRTSLEVLKSTAEKKSVE
jgi:hypothetical protein